MPGDVAQRRVLGAALGQRPGGLALEVEDRPAAVGEQGLAEVEVAVDADRHPRRRRSRRGHGAGRGAPRRGGRSARSARRRPAGRGRSRSIRSSRSAVNSASDSLPRSSGAKAGSVGSPARAVCIAPTVAPSPRSGSSSESGSPASPSSVHSQPSRPSAMNSWTTPSVASAGRPWYSYQPSSLRDLAEPAGVEEAEHLELRVHPRLDPAVDLEDRVLAEDDRAVRLLGGDRPRLGVGGRGRALADPREDDPPVVGGDLAAADDQPQEARWVAPLGEQVVDGVGAEAGDPRALRAGESPSTAIGTW